MKKKLFSILALLCLTVMSAWADDSKVYALTEGDTFTSGQTAEVKNALAVGQYKAWLEIPVSASNARSLTLVFDDATKITTTNYTNLTNGDWYDLNGRKLQNMPTKKGIYILNGKKVVVK